MNMANLLKVTIVVVVLMVTTTQVSAAVQCGVPKTFTSEDFENGGNICGGSDTNTFSLAIGPFEEGSCGKHAILQACDFYGLHNDGSAYSFGETMETCVNDGAGDEQHPTTAGATAAWTTVGCRDKDNHTYLGFFAGLCKTGTWSQQKMYFTYPDAAGDLARTPNEICIVPVDETGNCGMANQWEAGAMKWSMYASNAFTRSGVEGYDYGVFKWYFDPSPLCNEGETVSYNEGVDNVVKLTMVCINNTTEVTREVMVMDFVQTYNYGGLTDGLWKPFGTGDVKITVEKTDDNGRGWVKVKVPREGDGAFDWAAKDSFVLYDPEIKAGADIAASSNSDNSGNYAQCSIKSSVYSFIASLMIAFLTIS